ncbi:MAG: universal stress protein [Thermomicrobiales bacterium]
MFKTILIALDGTPEAEAIVPTARALAHARYAELVLVRITDNYHPTAAENVAANQYLDEVMQRHGLGRLRVRTELRYGDVAEQLVAAAREANADLIALATHGRQGIARAWFGSVTEHVLANSPVPLLVLRAEGEPTGQIKRLLVPLDNTPESSAALDVARDVAILTAAHLHLVQVVEPQPGWVNRAEIAPVWEEEMRVGVQAHLDAMIAQLYARGIVSTAEAAIGPVAETIGQLARERGSDLIVMGTHGFTGSRRAVYGSVADEVVRTSGVPVLLIRQGAAVAVGVPQGAQATELDV